MLLSVMTLPWPLPNIAGSVEAFARLMNMKAREIGAHNTTLQTRTACPMTIN